MSNKAWRMMAANKTAEISVEGAIGQGWEDGVTAKDFIRDLKALGDLNQINLRIYSPGGSVMEGNAIFNALLAHPAKVTAQVDFAASMATVIAMAADEIIIAENGFFMIHNPWSIAMGDSDDMRKTADLLDKIKTNIVAAYKRHAKLSDVEIGGMMDAETWLTADEAIDFGFATAKSHAITVAAAIQTDMLKNIPDAARCFIDAPKAEEPAPIEAPPEEPETPAEPVAVQVDAVTAELIKAKSEAAYQEGYDAAAAEFTAKVEAKVAEAVAAAETKFAEASAKVVEAEAKAEKATSEVDALKLKIESMTAGFEYEPETAPRSTGTNQHPFFAKLAELKAEGLDDHKANKKIDAEYPHLRKSLIAAANKR